jgi:SAM-dependent methyltransferase
MIIRRLRTIEEFQDHSRSMQPLYSERNKYEMALQTAYKGSASFSVNGFSYPAKQMAEFQVDTLYSDGININWRERMVCPVTGLNNRLRAAIQFLDTELGLLPHESIYITEQVTPLYAFLAARHIHLTGSEFLGTDVPLGASDSRGIRNEDLTKLTFSDNSFDVLLSFECFEHMPNFAGGINEVGRVLKPGGRMLWSVPFRADLEKNLIRAEISEDGSIVHHHTPEYHGDPVNTNGCLCFTHFGWEMLNQVREAGFRDAYALAYWSDIFGYLGREQLIFVAVK